MYSRKLTIGRNILRVFEIAMFFAVSVLGYGLLVKTSSFNGKSKSRDHAPRIQRSLDLSGLHRELKVLPGAFRFPTEHSFTGRSAKQVNDFASAHSAPYGTILHPGYRFALHDSQHLRVSHPATPSLPCNLLQQNPVLLV
ncbi:MAG TPA: hypothetical protein VN371_04170 [Chlorobaculum sp.]|nr:hypothetical protein [Chlorobaculum sp.]